MRRKTPTGQGVSGVSTLKIWQLYTLSIAEGAVVTVQLTVLATVVALIIGLLGAAGRLYGPRWLHRIISGYVEVVRGTPEILQIFIIYFGLEQYGIRLPAFLAGVTWLALFGGAYATEVLRAGLESVDRGQREAATALGLSRWSALRRVILPQAVGVMLPALTNFLILQIKASSMAFTIGVADIMYQAQVGALSTFRTRDVYLIAALAYFLLCFPLSRAVHGLERRVQRYR